MCVCVLLLLLLLLLLLYRVVVKKSYREREGLTDSGWSERERERGE